MSTIYTDGAGNKYLGDCLWASHDSNFPNTKWLKAIAPNASITDFWNDMSAVLPTMGYTSFLNAGTWGTGSNQETLSVQFSGIGERIGFVSRLVPNQAFKRIRFISSTNSYYAYGEFSPNLFTNGYDYSCCFSSDSFYSLYWAYGSGYTSYPANQQPFFSMACKLRDVNPTNNYYTTPAIRMCLAGGVKGMGTFNVIPPVSATINTSGQVNSNIAHIVDNNIGKQCLQTGRAVYAIDCSDGQTPGAQWATDMWVYDNNSALGFPVIGRVPNLLLGVGTYTYLKPVKIRGSVFPDNGSPWFLPVATFAGKTVLMRCYSSAG